MYEVRAEIAEGCQKMADKSGEPPWTTTVMTDAEVAEQIERTD